MSSISDIDNLISEAIESLTSAKSQHEIDTIKSSYLGKKGSFTSLLKSIKDMKVEDKIIFGKKINIGKNKIIAHYDSLVNKLKITKLDNINSKNFDFTMEGRCNNVGTLHPISQVRKHITDIFSNIGFDIADGPEIETDYFNFTALNQPDDHPARSMHDTFYLDEKKHLLRTHTSPMQIRYMHNHKPPLKVVSLGKVYRVDSDATHSPMFHQMEGLYVNNDASLSKLKSLLQEFLSCFFDDNALKIRFRPSYFPFTEPSAEVDMLLNDKWLEIAGCGMVHPNVLKNVNINPKKMKGFAFGIGIDRLAMLKFKINDLRLFFENDLRFLNQFGVTNQ
jgi:phenylalanyl-tRNA synthetase alpha chain